MKLKQIEALRLVVQSGSVSLAARHLGVSQPAVSKMLRSVELSLGISLFNHRRGSLVPREELNALLPDIERAYLAVMELQLRARGLQSTGQQNVVIGCSAALSLSAVGPACARAMKATPNARIAVRVRNGSGLIDELVDGSVDVAITQLTGLRPGLQAQQIGLGGMMCVLPPEHPMLGAAALGASDLAIHPIITYPPSTRNGARIWDFIRRHDIKPDVVLVDQAAVACMMATRLHRIAIVETLLDVATLYPDLEPRLLLPPLSYPVYAVWQDKPQPAIVPPLVADIGRILGDLSLRHGGMPARPSGEHPRAPVEDVVRNVA